MNKRRTYWKEGRWVLLLDGEETVGEFADYVAGLENKAEAIMPIMQELEKAAKTDAENQKRLTEALENKEKLERECENLRKGMIEFSLRKSLREVTEENWKLRRIIPYFDDLLAHSKEVNGLLERYHAVKRRKGMPWRKLFRDTEVFLEVIAAWSR